MRAFVSTTGTQMMVVTQCRELRTLQSSQETQISKVNCSHVEVLDLFLGGNGNHWLDNGGYSVSAVGLKCCFLMISTVFFSSSFNFHLSNSFIFSQQRV